MTDKNFETKFQIGKNGLTEGIIQSLENNLKTHRQVRISVLKSAGRDKEELKSMAEEIVDKISLRTGYRILGFTIILFKLGGSKEALK